MRASASALLAFVDLPARRRAFPSGGFVLPIIFGIVLDWLGINSSCFMFLYGVVWVSLILNYTTEVRRLPVMGERISASAPAARTTPGAAS
jgi:nitrate/nitrite transporter NarK